MSIRQGPLDGLKILDFSTLLPGPYASMLLADMGAEVLRIESPSRADLLREMTPKYDERSYAHLAINRNKRSLALDLKSPQAKSIIHRLVASYDVLLEQFRPGVMQRLGLDYPSLKSVNSRLIYCALTGYGQSGCFRERAGHDINFLALSGLASYSGPADRGPVLSATQIADLAGGSHQAVMAILAAVIERQTSGYGQYLDVSMSDGAFALNTLYGASALATGDDPTYGSELLNGGHCYDYYRTSDGRYLSVGALEPQFAAGFLAAIGHPEWISRVIAEKADLSELKNEIREIFAKRSFAEWKAIFAELDVCVEPVLSVTEASEHPHFKARKMTIKVAINEQKSVTQIAFPTKFEGNELTNQVGAKLGEHSSQVLSELGFEEAIIQQLIESGTILQAG